MDSLKNHFLIAMPAMDDPNFSKTVTYICEHNSTGAMGLIINRPTQFKMSDFNESSDCIGDAIVYMGGPVQTEHGFVLHKNTGDHWDTTIAVSPEISLTTSQDIITALSNGTGPSPYLIVLGYASWGPDQLEQEISDNIWLHGPADVNIFDTAVQDRWSAAAKLLGIDIHLISDSAGHA